VDDARHAGLNDGVPPRHVTPKSPQSFGPYVLAIGQAMRARGLDEVAIFRAAGLERVPSADPLQRIDAATIARVYALAREATGDDCFGLRVAQHMKSTHLHALGPALLASATLRDFLERLVRFFPLISTAIDVHYTRRGEEAVLEATDIAREAPYESDDVFCAYIVRLVADVTDARCAPRRITLRRPRPADGGSTHAEHFRCPIEFGRSGLAIAFDGEALDVPLSGANRELASYADALAARYLAELDRHDVCNRLRLLVLERLESGRIGKDELARELNMSARTLQNRLAAHGTTFNDVVEEIRRGLATRYLTESARSITEIAFLLGFSGTSSFCRAFKRWTGRAPGDYRGACSP